MEEKLLLQFNDQLAIIQQHLFDAANIDNIFWQVQSIIRENPNINKPNSFLDWITFRYIDSIGIRVRSFSDRRKDTVSLWRFLEELKNYAPSLTRDWFLSNYEDLTKHMAQKWFDNIAGVGCDHVSKTTIK